MYANDLHVDTFTDYIYTYIKQIVQYHCINTESFDITYVVFAAMECIALVGRT